MKFKIETIKLDRIKYDTYDVEANVYVDAETNNLANNTHLFFYIHKEDPRYRGKYAHSLLGDERYIVSTRSIVDYLSGNNMKPMTDQDIKFSLPSLSQEYISNLTDKNTFNEYVKVFDFLYQLINQADCFK